MLSWIHKHMSVGARLGLIGALLLVPIVLLAGLFYAQSQKEISFAKREIVGVDYIQEAWLAFETGDAPARARFDAARAKFDPVLGTSQQSGAFREATAPDLRRAAGAAFFIAVADASNLTLDPDLDSYYTMDAVVTRLPMLHIAVVEMAEAAASNPEERPIAVATAMVSLDSVSTTLQASISAAMKANKDGGTRKALAQGAEAMAKEIEAVRIAVAGGEPFNEVAFDGAANKFWDSATQELDRILQTRIDHLQSRLVFWLGVSGAVLLVAGLLMMLISRAISSRISTLVETMNALAQEKTDVLIPCQDDTNETGKIAEALEIFKQGLIERIKLRNEAESNAEHTAELVRKLESSHKEKSEELARVVAYVNQGLMKLCEGDLSFRLIELFPVDYKAIRMDFNQTMGRLQDTMRTILESSESMRGTAGEIAAAADDLSRRTEQQAAGLEQTAAAIEQITVTVRRNAENAQRMREVATAAGAEAQLSGDVLRNTVSAMAKIEKSSEEITRILSVIDEITFQTNLLALNAGVEAARAGEAGRGFAVVASEVRALAQRSAEAAKEIKGIINSSASDVGVGVKLVGQTAESLEQITSRVAEIGGLVSAVAASAEEEARGVSEVNIAINQMDQITQQNAAMVEQSTAASHSLATEAQAMSKLVQTFKIYSPAEQAPLRRAG